MKLTQLIEEEGEAGIPNKQIQTSKGFGLFKKNYLSTKSNQTLTLCLYRNIGEKRKEMKGKGGNEKGREEILICLGGKRRERKGYKDSPFKSFQL